jgi:hypothetical protein
MDANSNIMKEHVNTLLLSPSSPGHPASSGKHPVLSVSYIFFWRYVLHSKVIIYLYSPLSISLKWWFSRQTDRWTNRCFLFCTWVFTLTCLEHHSKWAHGDHPQSFPWLHNEQSPFQLLLHLPFGVRSTVLGCPSLAQTWLVTDEVPAHPWSNKQEVPARPGFSWLPYSALCLSHAALPKVDFPFFLL